jgi:hypothetical protein
LISASGVPIYLQLIAELGKSPSDWWAGGIQDVQKFFNGAKQVYLEELSA